MTDEEIDSFIETLTDLDLSDDEAEQLAQVLSDAPPEVKAAFEDSFNIYSGQFDSYVPNGSRVPVRTRRVVIAVTAALSVMPKPSSSSQRRNT